jgi:hypothetical protein
MPLDTIHLVEFHDTTPAILSARGENFGYDLAKTVKGHVVVADPVNACGNITNKLELRKEIAIIQRGPHDQPCDQSIVKATVVEKHGIIGGIIIDDDPESPSASLSIKVISGDSPDDVTPKSMITTNQRSAKGPVSILECSPDGNYIIIKNSTEYKNKLNKEINLDGWLTKQKVDQLDEMTFNFPKGLVLKNGKEVKIWASASGGSHRPQDEIIWNEAENWGVRSNIITTLCYSVSDSGWKAIHKQTSVYEHDNIVDVDHIHAKTTYKKFSKGPVEILECSPDEKYIIVKNTNKSKKSKKSKDQNLDGWLINPKWHGLIFTETGKGRVDSTPPYK